MTNQPVLKMVKEMRFLWRGKMRRQDRLMWQPGFMTLAMDGSTAKVGDL